MSEVSMTAVGNGPVRLIEVTNDDTLSVTLEGGSRVTFDYESAQDVSRAAKAMRDIREAREAADEDDARNINQWLGFAG
jgi:hypothetical protein